MSTNLTRSGISENSDITDIAYYLVPVQGWMIDLRNGSRLQFVDQPSEQEHSIRAITTSSKMFFFCVLFMWYPSVFTLDNFWLLDYFYFLLIRLIHFWLFLFKLSQLWIILCVCVFNCLFVNIPSHLCKVTVHFYFRMSLSWLNGYVFHWWNSLAQDHAILQSLHEVVRNRSTCDLMDPDPQVLLRLRVILLCQLWCKKLFFFHIIYIVVY